jgi:hypothetical protein
VIVNQKHSLWTWRSRLRWWIWRGECMRKPVADPVFCKRVAGRFLLPTHGQ